MSTLRTQVCQAGVVVNPTKVDDAGALREAVDAALTKAGSPPAYWLETTEDDPGAGQATTLLQRGVDLVMTYGGDGTVRACAEALRETGVAMALLPGGTGNLLARNLGVPTSLDEALDVALFGDRRAIDVGTCNGDTFVVMAGLGIDAVMVRDAPEDLKGRLGWLAYGVSGLRAVRRCPVLRIEVQVDDRAPVSVKGVGLIAGNVGTLTGGMTLLPDAEPDDGHLQIAVLTPVSWRDWASLAVHVIARPDGARPHLQTWTGTKARVRLDTAAASEVDGDVCGSTRELDISLAPDALIVCVPTP